MRIRWRAIALVAVFAMLLVACGDGDGPTADGTAPGDGAATEPAELNLGVGVTEEPCPDAVNEDNGCIYLGTLSDFSGPFRGFGEPLVDGQTAFWERVNEEGGISGFDVNISENVEDTGYDPGQHAQRYRQIEPDILALGQTLGTPQTLGIIEDMQADDVIGAVSTWWSGWEFQDLILQTGSNYCVDAMNGIDWAVEEYDPQTVMTVFFPGDYGGDANEGVRRAAEANGIEVVAEYEQRPLAGGGDTAGAIDAIMQNQPDLVFITTGPEELGQIVGRVAARGQEQGYAPRFIGSHPTYNSALLDSEAADAITSLYNIVAPHENWGADTEAHRAMQEALGEGELPQNDGFTYGWMIQYPVRAALEAAIEQGDLTRETLVSVVEEITVDYEGALPDKEYGGDPNETAVRQTTIGQPNPDNTGRLGLETIQAGYTGSTAEEADLSSPCQELGG